MNRKAYSSIAAGIAAAMGTAAGLAVAAPATAASAVTARSSETATPAGIPTAGLFGLEPVVEANGEPRPYFTLTVAPDRSTTDAVAVSNGGPTIETVKIGVSDGITAANSGSAYGAVPDRCVGPGCWVTGLPETVVLQPHEQQALVFRVAVPAGTAPDQYLAGITAQLAVRPRAARTKPGEHSGTRVIIVNTVTVGVAVTVGTLSELRTKVEITKVTADYIQSLIRLNVAVRNTGQRFTRGHGEMTCKLGSVSRTYPVYMDTVLPGDSAGLAVNGIGMHSGTWKCAVALKDTPAGTATWTGDVVVAAAVAAATKRIAPNDYVVPSSPGIPIWAIVLMVLGGFILFSIWALILRRNHDRNIGKPTDT